MANTFTTRNLTGAWCSCKLTFFTSDFPLFPYFASVVRTVLSQLIVALAGPAGAETPVVSVRGVTSSLLSLYALAVADAILGNRVSYAHPLSPVERVLITSCGTQVPWNVTISRQKIDFVT